MAPTVTPGGAPAVQPAESSGTVFRLPARMGRYTLTKRLGVGGMAEVFLAQQDGPAGFQKLCVVKRILPHLAEDSRFVEMFQREARVAAMLTHSNIVSIYELGEVDGYYFIAMEHVDGAPLHTLARTAWRQGKSVPLEVVCCAIADAALGLHYAHELKDASGAPMRLVHRDISPDNLMINREGVTKILDFGIAKTAMSGERTATGELKGKIPFLSPEQILGEPVDRRADLYALGVTFYWLLTGKRPLSAPTDLALMQKVLSTMPERPTALNPSVPEGISDIVMALLEKDRDKRPAHGADVHDALAAALGTRRNVVAPFVKAILSAPEKSADEPDPSLEPGFFPSTPHTDEVRATWKRLASATPQVPNPPSRLQAFNSDVTLETAAVPAMQLDGELRTNAELRAASELRADAEVRADAELDKLPRSKAPLLAAALAVVGLAVAAVVMLRPADVVPAPVPPVAVTPPLPPPPPVIPPDPVVADPVAADPVAVNPVAADPVAADPVAADPVAQPDAPPALKREGRDGRSGKGRPVPVASTRDVVVKGPAAVLWQNDKGKVLGVGSATLAVPAGSKTIIAVDQRTGGKTTVVLGDGTVDYGALPHGKIQARANPYADVFLGVKGLGTTPFPAADVVAGTYVVRFRHEGREEVRTIEVRAGETARVQVDFAAK